MIRSNVGNVTTNAMQILSVGTTTASGIFGHAERALNNMTRKDRREYGKMQADKIKDDVQRYKTGGQDPTQHMSSKELTDYQKAKAKGMKDYTKEMLGDNEEEIDVDDIMGVNDFVNSMNNLGTNEAQEISSKSTFDVSYVEDFMNKHLPKYKNVLSNKDKENIMQDLIKLKK